MSLLGSMKDAVVDRAMRLMGDPRVTKVMTDPRLMSAAMKAVSVGGVVKGEIDKAARRAAGALGWATRDEVRELRSTIQSLEETIAALESRAASGDGRTERT